MEYFYTIHNPCKHKHYFIANIIYCNVFSPKNLIKMRDFFSFRFFSFKVNLKKKMFTKNWTPEKKFALCSKKYWNNRIAKYIKLDYYLRNSGMWLFIHDLRLFIWSMKNNCFLMVSSIMVFDMLGARISFGCFSFKKR